MKTPVPHRPSPLFTPEKIWNRSRAWVEAWPNSVGSVVLASLLVTGLVGGIRQLKGLQGLELLVYDQMVRLLPSRPTDTRLLVVGIDEEDLQKYQKYPISDLLIAQALQKIQVHQPKVIGLDIHRDLPQPPGGEALKKELQASNVIVIATGGNDANSEIPPPPEVPRERVGFNDLIADLDNITRRNLLYVASSPHPSLSFALRLALQYLNHPPLKVTEKALIIGETKFPRLQTDSGSYHLEPSAVFGWQNLISYHSAQDIARQVTLREVLSGQLQPDWVKDKIVLIGYTAPSATDVFATPYSAKETKNYRMPGVVIHAQIVSQLVSGVLEAQPSIRYLPQPIEWLSIAWGAFFGAVITWRLNRPRDLLLAGAIAVVILWLLGLLALSQSFWLPIVPIILALIGTGFSLVGQRAYYRLYHDALTNLPNRRYLLRYLQIHRQQKLESTQQLVGVLFLNLDRFKMINEGLGNEAGDHLLQQTAQRLQESLSEDHLLAHLGGDEFVICVVKVDNIQKVEALVQNIERNLKRPFQWQDKEIFLSSSIGITYQRRGEDFEPNELLRDALIAMYRAKDRGKDRHETFRSSMKSEAKARLEIETELRKAIAQEDFELYYQPIVSLKTGKIAGFEALIRWPSSQKGFVSPGQFIPIAEETGLIIPLGAWILRAACQQIKEWHEQFPTNPPLMMSINLSSRQFSQPDLVPQIRHILESIQVERQSLKLEITESMMMNNVEDAIALLQQLRELGLRLSIDDFGTGYSNLSYLHRFPIDTLKVDQSFVRQMYGYDDSDKYKQIVRTVIMLGHNLGLDVIAEGIETEEQMQALKSLDCEYGQGYLFSKPLPQEQIALLMEKNPAW